MSAVEDENEPYTRWQGFRIGQLGLCISLFLSFSVATLGFSVHLLVQPTYEITTCFAKVFFFLSVISGLLSVFWGSVACVTRLADFRTTAKVVKPRKTPDETADVERLRAKYKRLGWWTWTLFWGQLVGFALQVVGLILALGITYWSRLT